MSNYAKRSLELHKKLQGKLEMVSKLSLETKDDLSLAYTPGVAEPCRKIAEDKNLAYDLTIKGNTVAVISDGSAVLGLGNIGPEAGLPVMEGKAVLFKEFGGVNAVPLVLDTQDTEEIIETVKRLAPTFGGINLEDISAPRCFEIEQRLDAELDIPIFHDDQHGTAIVALAAMINALTLTGKQKEAIKIIINGVGAAGVAIAKLLLSRGVQDVVMCDSRGIIYEGRENLNSVKAKLAKITNKENIQGGLAEAVQGRDVFIGVSVAGVLSQDMVRTMNPDPMIIAMANPIPEIMPEDAKAAGARIIATGRSDFPNQVNNVLVFPGIFKGALKYRISSITEEMKIAAAYAIASLVPNPTEDMIVPSPLNKEVAEVVAEAIGKFAQ